MSTLVVELPTEVDVWLDDLAKRTGKSKNWYAQQALVELMQDYRDGQEAEASLAEANPRIGLEELLKEFAHERRR